MEGLVAQAIALSNPNDLNQLLTSLKSSETVFTQNYQQIAPALAALDPSQHSLAYAFFLHHLGKGNIPVPNTAFIDTASRFLTVCSGAQIQLAPDIFVSVARKLKTHLLAGAGAGAGAGGGGAACPRRGIKPLLAGLRALQPNAEVLTPLHADFFQLCLLSRCYAAAAPVLGEDIYDVAPAQTGCTPTDLFLYCYYGGMLCIGRKQHARALELLLQALTAPALAGNAIVAAAYKKYVLVCLIHAGSLPPLPRFTSSCVKHVAEAEARPYSELAAAYAARSAERLRRVAEQHGQAFAADGNLGLVRQVLSSLAVRSIQRLTQTFLTLSLADIADNAGLQGGAAEAEGRVLRMVAAGQITARIDCRSGMVRFADDAARSGGGAATNSAAAGGVPAPVAAGGGGGGVWDSAASVAALDERMRAVLELNKRLQQAHEMVSQDRAYLTKVTARERSKYELGGGAAGLGGGLAGPGGGAGGEADFGPFSASGGSNM